jgi:hypothetical protein
MTEYSRILAMNLKTTVVLLALLVVGGLGWAAYAYFQSGAAAVQPPEIFSKEIKQALRHGRSDKPVRIVLEHGGQRVELERPAGQTEWTMPGNWPTRTDEVKGLVRLLAGMQSRFVASRITKKAGETEEDFGLDKPAVTVTLEAGDTKQVLRFGRSLDPKQRRRLAQEEGLGTENLFYQPTYLRLDDSSEVIRLPPGLVDGLRRSPKHFQQPWLFVPPETPIKGAEASAGAGRAEVLKSIAVSDKKDKSARYALTWTGSAWELSEPVHDRVDPDRLQAILAAVPDVWAEGFIEKQDKDLDKYGLKDPERTIRVTRANGQSVTVQVGKQSRVETRMVTPPPQPGAMQPPPRPTPVREEYYYAKLQTDRKTYQQVFEVKGDKLKELTVTADTLRDAKLARFKTEDARRVEIRQDGQDIVLVKKKDDWRLEKPADHEAEAGKITELLDKFSGLEARDADILDKAGLKALGLDPPAATVRVTVEEEKGTDDAKNKKARVITFHLGKEDAAKSKRYVQVAGWERVNAVDDSVFGLVKRPSLAYRGRRVLDASAADLAKVEVQRPTDPFTLEQVKNTWRLKAPVQAEVDSLLADQLAGDLARLEAVEYVTDSTKPEDLDKLYGLGPKPAQSARITFTDAKKPAQTVLVGKQRPGKPEYYAKLASGPAVFTVRKEVNDALAKSSLSYRPLQLWQMAPDDIGELQVRKGEPEYRLKRDGQAWKVSGPFEASAVAGLVRPMTEDLANLRAERYEAHVAKDLKAYGLDQPYLRVAVTPAKKDDKKADKKDDKKGDEKEDKKDAKERVLLVGKPADKEGKSRFAKLGDGEAIFVLGEKVLAGVDKSALDLLDRKLLALDTGKVKSVRSAGGAKGPLALERKGDKWEVAQSPAGSFAADPQVVDIFLGPWANLFAQTFAAYGPKADLGAYGLKTPGVTITVVLEPADKKGKPVEHTLALGKPVEGAKGERYALVDNGPGVAVLDAPTVQLLTQNYLDFVNRSAWKLDAGAVTALERRMGEETMEVAKKADAWQLVKPANHPADKPTLDVLVGRLANLRAKGVAAYPAKDLQPFGLNKPAAVVTLRLTGADKKPVEHVLKVGKPNEDGEAKGSGERFALADQSNAVIILPGALARQLVDTPLHFRDRTLPAAAGVDRITLERGPRKAVFAKMDGRWKMTQPVEAEVEEAALEAFLKALANPRAAELVADKPADLRPYGLDRPEARWRFSAGDKDVLAVLVGNRDPAKGGCYAKLAAGDLVFLLGAGLADQFLGEYRSRAVWTGVDAAQVEQVRYGYKQQPFVLTKADNDWQVAGMPSAKVKAEAVTDALAALAGLQAARYVVDQGADLKTYGLAEPQLVLEVKPRSGKAHVLHVGNREGDSKRYYARVAEGDSSAVFTISEEDAKRIVRPLKELTQAPSK